MVRLSDILDMMIARPFFADGKYPTSNSDKAGDVS